MQLKVTQRSNEDIPVDPYSSPVRTDQHMVLDLASWPQRFTNPRNDWGQISLATVFRPSCLSEGLTILALLWITQNTLTHPPKPTTHPAKPIAMAVRIIIITKRKPGLTPTQFKIHYETTHVPIFKSLAGDTFPTRHTRNYVERKAIDPSSPDTTNANYPATMFVGDASSVEHDAYAEVFWEDDAVFRAFMGKVGEEEAAARIVGDEEHFLDKGFTRIHVVGEAVTTLPER